MTTDESKPRLTHGRHCRCSACARQDWAEPYLAPCGMHGPSCPPIYDPYPAQPKEPTPAHRRQQDALDRVLNELREEVGRARAKHAPMHSPHEGWAVIREELDPELWEHVCHDTGRSPEARHEALQVAAMGVRYILDLIDDPRSQP